MFDKVEYILFDGIRCKPEDPCKMNDGLNMQDSTVGEALTNPATESILIRQGSREHIIRVWYTNITLEFPE